MKNSRLLRWGKFILALAIFFFLLKHLYNSLIGFEIETLVFQPFWLIMSFGILIGYRTLLVYPWRTLYRSATHLPVSFQASWILFQLSQVSKYLPGKVGQFVGIIALCRPLGLSKTAAIVSTLQALVIQCTLGFGIGMPVLVSPSANHFLHKLGAIFRRNILFISITVVVIIGIGCILFIFCSKGRFVKKIEPLQKVGLALFSVAEIHRLLIVYLLLWGYFGIAFFLFIKSIGSPIQLHHFLMIISIYPLAWSIGLLSLVTPGGLGVREGVLSILLTLCVPPTNAMLIALLSRVWVISVEILLAGIAWGIYYRQKHLFRLNENTADL